MSAAEQILERVGEEVLQEAYETLDSASDEFATPDKIFKPLHEEFGFLLDAAASYKNAKISNYITKEENALTADWFERAIRYGADGARPPAVWCNPPYSRGNVEAFVKKAEEESRKGLTVVLLLPARTEQPWFHDIVLKYAEVRFIRKRVKFIGGVTSARFPSLVAIFPNKTERQMREMRASIPRIKEPDTSPETRCVP